MQRASEQELLNGAGHADVQCRSPQRGSDDHTPCKERVQPESGSSLFFIRCTLGSSPSNNSWAHTTSERRFLFQPEGARTAFHRQLDGKPAPLCTTHRCSPMKRILKAYDEWVCVFIVSILQLQNEVNLVKKEKLGTSLFFHFIILKQKRGATSAGYPRN